MTEEKLFRDTALSMGASAAAVIDVSDISFRVEFRELCERNACGKYGRCWMCPPDVGPIDQMIERAKRYEKALVFQTIGALEDSFDIESMERAAKEHNRVTQAVADALTPAMERPLVIGAGACQVCSTCSRTLNLPCAHPDRAIPSLEAFGIAVSEMASLCGMNYINGQNTVTYFSAIFYGGKA